MEALLEPSIATREPVTGDTTNLEGRNSLPKPAPAPIEKELGNLVISDSGEQKYIGEYSCDIDFWPKPLTVVHCYQGPSSGFSLFSPRGLAWMQRKIGSNKVAGVFAKLSNAGPIWPSFRFGHLQTAQSVKYDLPPKDVAARLADSKF
jgi:hypothetical protein